MTYRNLGTMNVSAALPVLKTTTTVSKTLLPSATVQPAATYSLPTYVEPVVSKEPQIQVYQPAPLAPKVVPAAPVISTLPTYTKPAAYTPPPKEEDPVQFLMLKDTDTSTGNKVATDASPIYEDTKDSKIAAVSTLYAYDDQVKDPFSAKTITGGSDLKQRTPVLVETADGEKIDATDADEGTDLIDTTDAEGTDQIVLDETQVDEGTDQIDRDETQYNEGESDLVAPKAEGTFKWWWVALGVGAAGAGLWFLFGRKRRENGRRR